MSNPIELRISRLLGRMKRLSAYLDLGFARMTDYAVERLGLSSRSTHVLLRIDDGLRRLPATARAALAHESAGADAASPYDAPAPASAPAIDSAAPDHVPAIDTPAIDPHPIGAADDEPHVEVSFPAPGWVRGQWDWAVETFRRTAGVATPIWQAAEGFAADYLAGLPRLAPDVVATADEAAGESGAGRRMLGRQR